MLFHPLATALKHILDVISISVVVGTIVHALPPLAAGLSIVWLSLQMYTWWRRKSWRTDQEVREAAKAALEELDK